MDATHLRALSGLARGVISPSKDCICGYLQMRHEQWQCLSVADSRPYQEAQHRAATRQLRDEGHRDDRCQQQPDGLNEALLPVRDFGQRQLLHEGSQQRGHLYRAPHCMSDMLADVYADQVRGVTGKLASG